MEPNRLCVDVGLLGGVGAALAVLEPAVLV